jgi:phosphate transport system protein
MPRDEFERELAAMRQEVLLMAGQVESQIHESIGALQRRDVTAADAVREGDRELNELFREIREQCLLVIAKQQPVARDLRNLMGVLYIAAELERMGDYAVRIARMASSA